MTKPPPRSVVFSAFFIAVLSPLWSACGTSQDVGNGIVGQTVSAPVISSSAAGLLFTGAPRDPYSLVTSVYFYDFKAGLIKTLSSAEGGNPVVFWDGSSVWHFSRKSGESAAVWRFDPLASDGDDDLEAKASERWTVDWPAAGDPVSLVAGIRDEVILGAPFSGGLYNLSPRGKLQLGPDSGQEFAVPTGKLHPTALGRTGDKILVAHSSLRQSDQNRLTTEGESQLFVFSSDADLTNTTTAINEAFDTDQQTPVIDGTPLSASFPTLLTFLETDIWSVAGLCPPISSPCRSGVDLINPVTSQRDASYTLEDDFPYTLRHDLTPGPDPTKVFAQVVSKIDQQQQIGLLDYKSGEFDVWYTFGEDRLFGSAFDLESSTLIVGEQDALRGKLLLLRDGNKVGEVALDDVFYKGVIIGRK